MYKEDFLYLICCHARVSDLILKNKIHILLAFYFCTEYSLKQVIWFCKNKIHILYGILFLYRVLTKAGNLIL